MMANYQCGSRLLSLRPARASLPTEEIMPATSRTAKAAPKPAVQRPPSMTIEVPDEHAPQHAVPAKFQDEELSYCIDPASQEILLDEAIEMTFPASDPIAEHPQPITHACPDGDELMLDDAIALTFPASDPIAFTPHVKARP